MRSKTEFKQDEKYALMRKFSIERVNNLFNSELPDGTRLFNLTKREAEYIYHIVKQHVDRVNRRSNNK